MAATTIAACVPASCRKPTLSFTKASAGHTFDTRSGHISDTAANRNLLISVGSNKNNFLGKDSFGNSWYSRILSNGTQVWVETRDGIIKNGGINQNPINFNPTTGLSSPTKPK